MNIVNVSISKLFGIFDHYIPFNQDSGVTIIIGENGIGKTKVLEAVNAIFNKNYEFLIELDFDRLIISFDNQESWTFSKSIDSKGSDIYKKAG